MFVLYLVLMVLAKLRVEQQQIENNHKALCGVQSTRPSRRLIFIIRF